MKKKTQTHRVLFVCLGNICRSPLAEGVFTHLVNQRNLDEAFNIDSCGTIGNHIGQLADPRSRTVALRHGFTLTHKARKITVQDFDDFSYIMVMDQSNYRDVLALAPSESDKQKVYLMSAFDPEKNFSIEVPDPYYDPDEAFEAVYQQVLHCSENLLTYILSH